MTMTREKIEELKRLAEKATPGEWVVSNRTEDPMNGITMISFISPANDTSPEAIVCETLGGEHDDYANAAFIAAFSPATASALLALAERALEPPFTAEEIAEMKAHTARDVATRNAWLEFNKSIDSPPEPQGQAKTGAATGQQIVVRRDRIEKLLEYSDKDYVPNSLFDEFRALLTSQLVESQGQALPELQRLTPLDGIQVWIDAYTNADNGPHFMGHGRIVQLLREYLELRKQLALPAGPVPEGATIPRSLLLRAIQAINYHLEPESPEEHEQTIKELGTLLDRSPAVAQPVADERGVMTLFSIRKDADGVAWLYFDGGMVSLNNIANESGPIVCEAMSRAIKAMKGGA